jgi:hypothetical protein
VTGAVRSRRAAATGWVATYRWTTAVLVLVVTVGFALAVWWFGPQKLFLDETVEEPFPVSLSEPVPTVAASGSAAGPVARPPEVLLSGDVRSRGHEGSGVAGVVRLPDGSLVLRLEDLDVSNGPDLRVVLSRHGADADNDAIARDGLDLGPLKANRGNQTYDVPAGTDLDAYGSVIVWCRRFSYVFAAAPLSVP